MIGIKVIVVIVGLLIVTACEPLQSDVSTNETNSSSSALSSENVNHSSSSQSSEGFNSSNESSDISLSSDDVWGDKIPDGEISVKSCSSFENVKTCPAYCKKEYDSEISESTCVDVADNIYDQLAEAVFYKSYFDSLDLPEGKVLSYTLNYSRYPDNVDHRIIYAEGDQVKQLDSDNRSGGGDEYSINSQFHNLIYRLKQGNVRLVEYHDRYGMPVRVVEDSDYYDSIVYYIYDVTLVNKEEWFNYGYCVDDKDCFAFYEAGCRHTGDSWCGDQMSAEYYSEPDECTTHSDCDVGNDCVLSKTPKCAEEGGEHLYCKPTCDVMTCDEGYTCYNGACVIDCDSYDCGEGRGCKNNRCYTSCEEDTDCSEGNYCPKSGECRKMGKCEDWAE